MADLFASIRWKRFWIPRETPPLLDGRGYFADPEAEFGKQLNPKARTLEELDDTPCVALLGEPGIGKSHVVYAYARARTGDSTVLYIDFRFDNDLKQALLDTNAFQRWRAGEAPLSLLLDSLDEHPQGADKAARQLIGQLRHGPAASLRLRVACRTVEWPRILDEELPRLWQHPDDAPESEAKVAFYALAPLRWVDVVAAAKEHATGFLDEVERMSAEPLAIKPITLGFLLEQYRRHRQLPHTRVKLYGEGCKILCAEKSPTRESERPEEAQRAEERLAIASRIAAVSILGRRSLLYKGPYRGPLPEEAIYLDELAGGVEPGPRGDVTVDTAALKEVLEVSGLFAPRGEGIVGWAHQTYAEFLAACFLKRRGLPAEQLLGEVMSPTMNRTVPILFETAAWLASLDKDVFQRLLHADPEPLLGSDFAMVGAAKREVLVEALLRKIDQQELFGMLLTYEQAVQSKLDHPKLAEQLRPYITDRSRYVMARRAAIGIAEGCKVKALEALLADVALDPDEEIDVRAHAAKAIAKIGSRDTKRRLKPLVLGQLGPDPDDELKGYALQALWPEDLTSDDFFANLTPPRNEFHGGAYLSFLYELEGNVRVQDLQAALQWTLGLPARHEHDQFYTFLNLLDKFLAAGWEHIEESSIRMPFAEAIRQRLALHDRIFETQSRNEDEDPELAQSDAKRRLLASALLALPPLKHEVFAFVHRGLILPRDVPWAIEQLKSASDPSQRARWADILQRLAWRYGSFEVFDPILAALDEVTELLRVVFYRKVDLGSLESRWMRREYRRSLKESRQWAQTTRGPKRKLPPARRLIRHWLRRFNEGNQEAGWQLQRWMLIDPQNKTHHHELNCDLTELPGWQQADESTREQILNVGRQYLLDADDAAEKWLAQTVPPRPAATGYRYLCLIDKLDPGWLDKNSAIVWKRWAAVTLDFSFDKGRKLNQQMVARTYQAEPDRTLYILGKLLDRDHKIDGYPRALDRMTDCWDERLGRFLLDFAHRADLKPEFLGSLLDALLAHSIDGAAGYAVSLLTLPVPTSGEDRLRMHAAAHALLIHGLEAGWPAVWPLLRADPAFGREVFLTVAYKIYIGRAGGWSQNVPTVDVMELYLWLKAQFPTHEDSQQRSSEPSEVTPRRAVAHLRDGLPSMLASRGTPEAVACVERIHRAHPERDWTWALLAAKQAAAQGTWVPRTPREIIEFRPAPERALALVEGDLSMGSTVDSPADIVILCALGDPELEKVKRAGGLPWTELPMMKIDPHSYYATTYTTARGAQLRVVAAAPNHMGMPASAVLATKMIIRFRPRLVVMVGIAAGVQGKGRGFGDVLAAEHTFDYGSGKVTLEGEGDHKKVVFHPDPKPLDVDTRLLGRLRHWQSHKSAVLNEIRSAWSATPPDTVLKLHLGPMASVAAVVDAREPVDQIVEHWRKLVGLEMEAYAVHRACKDTLDPPPKFLCLKAISDLGHDKTDDLRSYAAFTAAELCYRFLVEEWENLGCPER